MNEIKLRLDFPWTNYVKSNDCTTTSNQLKCFNYEVTIVEKSFDTLKMLNFVFSILSIEDFVRCLTEMEKSIF